MPYARANGTPKEYPTRMSERETKQEVGRLGFIEGIRGLAAFYVVLQHICTMVDPRFTFQSENTQPAWLGRVMGLLWYGHFAVAAFIVVSGFCLQMSLYSRGDGRLVDWKRFLKRRCWRILPPYYACLAFSLVTVFFVTNRHEGPPWSQYVPVTIQNTVAHIFMVHNFSRDWMYKINGVLWSISIEFQLYFLFPLLCFALWRWGARIVLPLVAAGIILVMHENVESTKLYVWYFGLFVLGMAGAKWAFDPRTLRPPALAMSVLALVAMAAAIMSISWTKQLAPRDTLMGIAVISTLVAGAVRPTMLWVRLLGARPLVGLGAFSYSLYLVHHPLLQWFTHIKPTWVSTPVRLFAYLVACLPLVLFACYWFYRWFEKPFVNRGKAQISSQLS